MLKAAGAPEPRCSVSIIRPAKIPRHAKAKPEWVMADRWSGDEIIPFYNLLWKKKVDELKFMKKRREKDIKGTGSEMDYDDEKVFGYRSRWMAKWSSSCGLFDNVTRILSMPFTYHSPPKCADTCETIQIYAVWIASLLGGLQWPIDVFGMVGIRDTVDRKLNLVFYRSRDNCQTLTEKAPYLALTGPTRAVVLGDVFVEIDLKVRGNVESEDRCLSFVAAPLKVSYYIDDRQNIDGISRFPTAGPTTPGFLLQANTHYQSKCSSVLLLNKVVTESVEATIFIQAIEGSWTDGITLVTITASGSSDFHNTITLFDSEADKVPIGGGHVELSRRVVSVSYGSELLVYCTAMEDGRTIEAEHSFSAAATGRNRATLHLGTCKLEIIVAWSLVSQEA